MENQAPRDFEKIMEFILEQQAKFAVDIQQLRESQARLEAAQERLQTAQERLEAAQERTDAMVRNLVDVCMSLPNHAERLDQALSETADKLNGLIGIVDKLARRNGGEQRGTRDQAP